MKKKSDLFCFEFIVNSKPFLLLFQELESKLRTNGIKVEETNIDQSLLLSTIIKSEVVNNTGEQNEMKKVRCNYNLPGSLLDVRVQCLLIFRYFFFSFSHPFLT